MSATDMTYIEHVARRCGDALALAIIAARDEGDSPDYKSAEEWRRIEWNTATTARTQDCAELVTRLSAYADAISSPQSKAIVLEAINAIEVKL